MIGLMFAGFAVFGNYVNTLSSEVGKSPGGIRSQTKGSDGARQACLRCGVVTGIVPSVCPVAGPLQRRWGPKAHRGSCPLCLSESLVNCRLLSRNLTDNSCERNELHIESSGLFCDSLQSLVLVFGFVELSFSVYVVVTKLQHPVNETGEHVGHRGDGFGGAEFGA